MLTWQTSLAVTQGLSQLCQCRVHDPEQISGVRVSSVRLLLYLQSHTALLLHQHFTNTLIHLLPILQCFKSTTIQNQTPGTMCILQQQA